MTGRIGFPFVEVELADGVRVALAQSRRLTRFSGPGHCSSVNHQKLVSAAGIAPAVPWFQTRDVAATPRAVRPDVRGAHRGLVFMGNAGPVHLEPESRGKIRKLVDANAVAPSAAKLKGPGEFFN